MFTLDDLEAAVQALHDGDAMKNAARGASELQRWMLNDNLTSTAILLEQTRQMTRIADQLTKLNENLGRIQ